MEPSTEEVAEASGQPPTLKPQAASLSSEVEVEVEALTQALELPVEPQSCMAESEGLATQATLLPQPVLHQAAAAAALRQATQGLAPLAVSS